MPCYMGICLYPAHYATSYLLVGLLFYILLTVWKYIIYKLYMRYYMGYAIVYAILYMLCSCICHTMWAVQLYIPYYMGCGFTYAYIHTIPYLHTIWNYSNLYILFTFFFLSRVGGSALHINLRSPLRSGVLNPLTKHAINILEHSINNSQ